MGDPNLVSGGENRTRRLLSIVLLFLGVTTYVLLPERVRALTRLSLSFHACLIAVLTWNLILPNPAMASNPWWRIRVPLLIALVSIFVGRVSDLLFRWEIDWPGMWTFLGLIILIWAVLRPAPPEKRSASLSAPPE